MVHGLRDQRDCGRRRVLRGGTIAFSGRSATLSCVVRDISDHGARLQVEQSLRVPDTFELFIDLDGIEVACEVKWRGARELGVAFCSAPRFEAPKRAQVVMQSTAAAIEAAARQSVRRVRPQLTAVVGDAGTAPASVEEAGFPTGLPLLVAEDDPDDRAMIVEAFDAGRFRHPITFVSDGEALLDVLRGVPPATAPLRPGLILLDLNMPRMDGRTALMHLKTDRELRRIPVVVLTTSSAEADIERTYELGVSAFVSKPSSQDDMIELVHSIDMLWMRRASVPRVG